MGKKKYNVLLMDFNSKKIEYYDVLPYFREEWKENQCLRDENYNEFTVKTKDELKTWIKSCSLYRFWSRCEYEFLVGPWPFGGRKLTENMENFIATNPNLKDHRSNIDMCNIITNDMSKIDVHEQIMMNIDVITDLLYEEFLEKNE